MQSVLVVLVVGKTQQEAQAEQPHLLEQQAQRVETQPLTQPQAQVMRGKRQPMLKMVVDLPKEILALLVEQAVPVPFMLSIGYRKIK
jgi:hypothetical protein